MEGGAAAEGGGHRREENVCPSFAAARPAEHQSGIETEGDRRIEHNRQQDAKRRQSDNGNGREGEGVGSGGGDGRRIRKEGPEGAGS